MSECMNEWVSVCFHTFSATTWASRLNEPSYYISSADTQPTSSPSTTQDPFSSTPLPIYPIHFRVHREVHPVLPPGHSSSLEPASLPCWHCLPSCASQHTPMVKAFQTKVLCGSFKSPAMVVQNRLSIDYDE